MGLFLLGFVAGIAATIGMCVVLYRLTPDDPADDPDLIGGATFPQEDRPLGPWPNGGTWSW
jgi:hypothetical protein